MKSEILNPKLERSPNCEIRKDADVLALMIRSSVFGFLSVFDIRISDLRRKGD